MAPGGNVEAPVLLGLFVGRQHTVPNLIDFKCTSLDMHTIQKCRKQIYIYLECFGGDPGTWEEGFKVKKTWSQIETVEASWALALVCFSQFSYGVLSLIVPSE